MAKYRIKETAEGTWHPQEKKSFLRPWNWLDKDSPSWVWWAFSVYGKRNSRCYTFEKAKLVIEKRIEFLEKMKHYPKIHKYPCTK